MKIFIGTLLLLSSMHTALADEVIATPQVGIGVATDGVVIYYPFNERHSVFAGLSYGRVNSESSIGNTSDSTIGYTVGYRYYLQNAVTISGLRHLVQVGLEHYDDKYHNTSLDYKTRGTSLRAMYGLEYRLSKQLAVEGRVGVFYGHTKTTDARGSDSADYYHVPITAVGINYYFH